MWTYLGKNWKKKKLCATGLWYLLHDTVKLCWDTHQTSLWQHVWMCHPGGCNLIGLQVLPHATDSVKDPNKTLKTNQSGNNCLWPPIKIIPFLGVVLLLPLQCTCSHPREESHSGALLRRRALGNVLSTSALQDPCWAVYKCKIACTLWQCNVFYVMFSHSLLCSCFPVFSSKFPHLLISPATSVLFQSIIVVLF